MRPGRARGQHGAGPDLLWDDVQDLFGPDLMGALPDVHVPGARHVPPVGNGRRRLPGAGAAATRRRVDPPQLGGVAGRYFEDEKEARAATEGYDPQYRTRLAAVTTSLLRPLQRHGWMPG
ncbi:hypothetical protein [Actinacidiphila sp. bgisy160]|uniref:hypothetical protein n=1 Tax=Actinacidiphila sp. bgisy160 TaxID=3413796 RepID=UPI003D733EC1